MDILRTVSALALFAVLIAGWVGAPISSPDLSWISSDNEGHTFHYRVSNSTDQKDFNVTLVEYSDGTSNWVYWVNKNGSEVPFNDRYQQKDRQDSNFTSYFTVLYVNTTNVLDGIAPIGNGTYNLTDTTQLYFVFSNATRDYYYDIDHGWLSHAEYYRTGESVDLIETYDGPNPIPPPPYHPCGATNEIADQDASFSTRSRAAICWYAWDNTSCKLDWFVEAHVRWPTWALWSYEYEFRWPGNSESGPIDPVGSTDLMDYIHPTEENQGFDITIKEGDSFSVSSSTDRVPKDSGDHSDAGAHLTC